MQDVGARQRSIDDPAERPPGLQEVCPWCPPAALLLAPLLSPRHRAGRRPDRTRRAPTAGSSSRSTTTARFARRRFRPTPAPPPPPVDAAVTRIDYDLTGAGRSAVGGTASPHSRRPEGWLGCASQIPRWTTRRRCPGRWPCRCRSWISPSPHVLLSRRGRSVIALQIVLPLKARRPPPSRSTGANGRRGHDRGCRCRCPARWRGRKT